MVTGIDHLKLYTEVITRETRMVYRCIQEKLVRFQPGSEGPVDYMVKSQRGVGFERLLQ